MEETRAKQVRYREINRPCKFRSVIQIRRGSCRRKAAVEFIPYFGFIPTKYPNTLTYHAEFHLPNTFGRPTFVSKYTDARDQ